MSSDFHSTYTYTRNTDLTGSLLLCSMNTQLWGPYDKQSLRLPQCFVTHHPGLGGYGTELLSECRYVRNLPNSNARGIYLAAFRTYGPNLGIPGAQICASG